MVVVEKRVESCAVEVFQTRGRRAVMDVVPKVEPLEPQVPVCKRPFTSVPIQFLEGR